MADEAKDKRVSSWTELFERSIELGLGAAMLTAESAQKLVNDMVNRGQVPREESTSMVDRLLTMGREQRDMLRDTIEKTTERMMTRMNMARQDEVDALRKRVDDLERIVLNREREIPLNPVPPEGEDYLLDQE